MKIGDRVILVRGGYSKRAYQDQCCLWREGFVVTCQWNVTIDREREVKAVYSDKIHMGYSGTAEDGMIFGFNWEHYDDASSYPYAPDCVYGTQIPGHEEDPFQPVDLCAHWPYYGMSGPIISRNTGKLIHPEGCRICWDHSILYYPGSGFHDKCFFCEHGMKQRRGGFHIKDDEV